MPLECLFNVLKLFQDNVPPNPSQPVGGVSRAIVFSIRIGESEMVGRVIVSCEPLDPFVSSII